MAIIDDDEAMQDSLRDLMEAAELRTALRIRGRIPRIWSAPSSRVPDK
jgi:hypothetical protein